MRKTSENVADGLITIEGCVDSVLFKNSENGYIVLDLETKSDMVTVVGMLGEIDAGEELTVTGKYVVHPRFGDQFKAEYCQRRMPVETSAILKYLSSGVIKGIGPVMAKKIVEKFGGKSLEIIETEPEKLLEIKGITKNRAEEISREMKRINGIKTLMMFLSQFGILPSAAVKVWKRWGRFSEEMIRENPYILCKNGIGLDFSAAENIAEKQNIPKNDLNRIRAGIFYILDRNTLNGHSCLPCDKLIKAAVTLLQCTEEEFRSGLESESDDGNLVIFEKKDREFVYIAEYFKAEQYITDRLSLLRGCFIDSGDDCSKLIEIEEQTKNIEYAEQQKKAISLALSQGFLILTGGPGTGKTTALKAIISLYEQRGMKVTIAAPTGRAAKRIADLTGYPAKTIHRLLEVVYDSTGELKFKHNENEPLSCDVMIVDEMSMVDSLLFESLLKAMKLSCRLIMVGDSDQLPSVGAGNLLKDLIECNRLTVVKLNEIFRQARESMIITNAHKIVNGEDPILSCKDNDFFFMQRLDGREAQELVSELYCERLPKAYGYSPYEDIQVLCPSRKGILGVTELNRLLQEKLNPPENGRSEVKSRIYTFRDNDKVMQTKNNYDIVWKKGTEEGCGIFNGDIGTVIKIRRGENTAVIDFEGRIAEYTADMLDQLELAYAVTVHKSQGSEFNAVILPLLGGYDKLFCRNLLYTAVTRAKKLLIIVGSKTAVEAMVANNRRTLRYSCLKYMLETSMEERGG